MPKDHAGSGSGPVLVAGPSHDPMTEQKKQTLVDQENQGNGDHHPNNDINKGNVTAVITDIQSKPAKPEKKNWVFYRHWCSGYDDVFGDKGCGFCGRGHNIERCRRYRRQRKLDAQCQARSSSTPLSSKD